MVEVRLEQASDIEGIRHINDLAFGQPEEGINGCPPRLRIKQAKI
ncbi:MAG: hypothetical protein ABIF87_08285 [Pseudomonadota bacterium]